MQRRGVGRQPPKGQRRRTKPKAHKVPTARASIADRDRLLDQRTRERDEALEQLAATSGVLRVISRSAFDLQSVFDTLVESAARLCRADYASIRLNRDGFFHHVANCGYTSEQNQYMNEHPVPAKPDRGSIVGRVLSAGKAVQIEDTKADPEFRMTNVPGFKNVHTHLGVPLLREGKPIGVLVLMRGFVEAFTDKQIELVKTFAAQAVIAIENTRLLNELRESLQQQTATADVLNVISSSPGELPPVFSAILANATSICEAKFGVLYLHEGGAFRAAATTPNAPPEYVKARKPELLLNPPPDGPLRRVTATKQVVQIADLSKLQSYLERDPFTVAAVELGRFRTALGVPMLKDGEVVGAITILRQEVRPFTDKQVKLMENFAAQAVIAIENTRLLNELRESLQQQTATADVLKVISRSTFDLPKVLNALVASAAVLCEADKGGILRPTGKDASYYYAATYGHTAEYNEHIRMQTFAPGRGGVVGRVLLAGKSVQIPDVLADPEYTYRELAELSGRTILGVPLLREGNPIGLLVLHRGTVRPFADKQIELVETFADQAVIAIENARLFEAEQQRTRELSESLEQQTATSEVLQVISSAPGELEPIFNAMLAKATRICEAKFGILYRSEGDVFRTVAMHGAPQPYVKERQRDPIVRPAPATALGRALATKQPVQIADILKELQYLNVPAGYTGAEFARLSGARTVLVVPMLKDNELVGAITIYRQEVRPFTEKQIELVKNFAAQAVIAIENARLLNELRQRTDDLSESLEQQTATSEVLKVISSSPGVLEPVFNAMLENAVRICGAKFGNLMLLEGDAFRTVALYGAPPAYAEARRREPLTRPRPQAVLGQVLATKQPAQIADVQAERAYYEDPSRTSFLKLAGARTVVAVPMLKEDELVGAIFIYRQEVRPFTEKQIELLKNFAAQAVIAIENTRLLNELRQRTDDLTESLEQQTATSEVLKVISSSPGELEPVFNAMLANATRICEATFGNLFLREGSLLQAVAVHSKETYSDYYRRNPIVDLRDHPKAPITRVVHSKQVFHISDLRTDESYIENDDRIVALVEVAGARALVVVPMLKEGELVGAIVLYRQEVRPFTDKQIELVQNFAAQAVIAIENTRLLSELRESLQRQTATADVLKVISRSTFDLQTVLNTLVESAARLCDADHGTITRQIDGIFYRAAAYGHSLEFSEAVRNLPVEIDGGSVTGRALLEGRIIDIPDIRADSEFTFSEALNLANIRTGLGVPMLREGVPIGVLALGRSEVRPFTDKQIELVSTFADQAAIAIENVRLFESVEARTRELAASLENLRSTQDRLVQTQKLASLGQLTAGIAHEIKNPLNFVNNFSGVSVEIIDELQDALKCLPIDQKGRAEIKELTDTLRGNLDKVVQHGKRADAIVKNMLLHSREGSGEHRVVDINALVEESLNLAWHGARAEKQGFNITLERSFDPAAGKADVFPQDITRVLLNLISNGFYAAAKRKAEAGGDDYESILAASTKNLGDRVEITIRDNGTGILPDVKEKMFNPFFTTKPAGEGTGLGLSISHDIIVKQHGGSIDVDTMPGEFTAFRITLSRNAAAIGKVGEST
jgi:GAF domain-containing protein